MTRNSLSVILLSVLVAAPGLVLLLGYRFAEEARGLASGEELPRAKLLTQAGASIETGEWIGMPTLLVVFRSTCRSCEREILGLAKIAHLYPEGRVVLLSQDSAPLRFDVPFEVFFDPTGEFIKRTRRLVVPTLYWIGAEGRVLHVQSGSHLPGEDRLHFERFFRGAHP